MNDRTPPKGRSFSFNISFGKKPPPVDDPRVQELLERAEADAARSPDGVGMASDTQTYRVDLREGLERIGDLLGVSPEYEDASGHISREEDPKAAREREMWDRLHLIAEGKGAYPDTQRWHARLSLFTTIIAISLPVAALILTLATAQTTETVFFVTLGAAIVAAMFRSSIR